MIDLEKQYWAAFNVFFLFGPKKFSLLLKHFGSAQKAWKAPEGDFHGLPLHKGLLLKFFTFRQNFKIQNYLDRLTTEGITLVTLGDSRYPKLLKEIGDPPFALNIKTKIDLKRLFSMPALAVVGTRKMSGYGRVVTQQLTAGLVEKGYLIVSGLARGVDITAHQTALLKGGLTIAVLGSGIDCVYPIEHLRISREIVEKGALVSEFPLGYRPFPTNFPIRNRIISGLSTGIVVTEAAEKSGSMITVTAAAEQGREVFAVPGQITSFSSLGTSEILKKGAKLVTKVEDILEELPQF